LLDASLLIDDAADEKSNFEKAQTFYARKVLLITAETLSISKVVLG